MKCSNDTIGLRDKGNTGYRLNRIKPRDSMGSLGQKREIGAPIIGLPYYWKYDTIDDREIETP